MALQLGALRDGLLDARLAGMDTKLALPTWMVGFNLILTVGVLWRLLAH